MTPLVEPVNCATGDPPRCPTHGDDLAERFPCGCWVYECGCVEPYFPARCAPARWREQQHGLGDGA